MSRILPISAIAFLIYYLATAPTDAAGVVHTTLGFLGSLGTGLSNFVTQVA